MVGVALRRAEGGAPVAPAAPASFTERRQLQQDRLWLDDWTSWEPYSLRSHNDVYTWWLMMVNLYYTRILLADYQDWGVFIPDCAYVDLARVRSVLNMIEECCGLGAAAAAPLGRTTREERIIQNCIELAGVLTNLHTALVALKVNPTAANADHINHLLDDNRIEGRMPWRG